MLQHYGYSYGFGTWWWKKRAIPHLNPWQVSTEPTAIATKPLNKRKHKKIEKPQTCVPCKPRDCKHIYTCLHTCAYIHMYTIYKHMNMHLHVRTTLRILMPKAKLCAALPNQISSSTSNYQCCQCHWAPVASDLVVTLLWHVLLFIAVHASFFVVQKYKIWMYFLVFRLQHTYVPTLHILGVLVFAFESVASCFHCFTPLWI